MKQRFWPWWLLFMLLIFGYDSAWASKKTSEPTVNSSAQLWSQFSTPTGRKSAKIYGGYSAGCLDGGVSLAPIGEGYQMMRLSRKRYYGHPNLVRYIQRLAKRLKSAGVGRLLVSDLSQARGGPLPGAHVSHQNGLDVDLWYLLRARNKPPFSMHGVETVSAYSVANWRMTKLNPKTWNEDTVRLIRYAAEPPEVERLLVTPVVKAEMCRRYPQASWLKKLRPWYGHHYHFHVRLKCPADSPGCAPQTPPVSTDCGAPLQWWLKKVAKTSKPKKPVKGYKKTAKKMRPLPQACHRVSQVDYWQAIGKK
ncbi:penicillin-insensitive murein endopeptidase [Magnetococcales bacterium HHB-1]